MSVSYQKVKGAVKSVKTRKSGISKVVLETMDTIAEIVGATLGPGGQPVLIERQEYGLPNIITKDGVTVFRSLGFADPVAHCVMEAARDASVRTATEAGDGTTTATILANALVSHTDEFCRLNPTVSPQRLVRGISEFVETRLQPEIQRLSRKVSLESEQDRKLLKAVAKVSGNGDTELADAVLECYDLVGDAGNVTIAEVSGHSGYDVERIEGYPITTGYDECCGRYYPTFINDQATASVKLEKPLFVLYYGKITDIQTLLPLLGRISDSWQSKGTTHNVVVVATGFSDTVLGHLAVNFPVGETLNVYPLLVPMSPIPNGQLDFLEDLAAVTGGKVLSQITKGLEVADLDDLGYTDKTFEAGRFRSNVFGRRDDLLILERVDILQKQLKGAASQLDATILQERIGKITGGIAKLIVRAPTSGEQRERRDRADDAICAVRGAIKHGCLPGGGWTLLQLWNLVEHELDNADVTATERGVEYVLSNALEAPLIRLLENAGLSNGEIFDVQDRIVKGGTASSLVYDAFHQKFVDAFEEGVLDSTPAVSEALRNSVSIATILGTLGGAVVFQRDAEFERREAAEAHQYLRDVGENPHGEN